MARIDIKNVPIYFRDGRRIVGTPAVNDVTPPAINATTVTVDGITGIVPEGMAIRFANHGTLYVVTATTETTGNTTEIVISPPLTAALVDNAAITSYGVQLEIKVGEGNITTSERQELQYIPDRGKMGEVRKGDEQPMEVSASFSYEFLKSVAGADTPTPSEAIKRTGPASTWVTTGSDPCEPYAINIVLLHEPPCDDVPYEETIYPEFRYTQADTDVRAGQVSFQGSCKAEHPIVNRIVR